ncbi:hypothetical protein TanjilG_25013 [Lupinus angustifolius]|uniref:Uncharacterized protein n=1 Tax=Lupinus angustifolius TaxID=3871 RepID=A0A1J7GI25_LUPAN|nr:hypothetical protein TanjilG_25013 [Lupinus angustifolius]
MDVLVFDGEGDTYWLLICIEKHFDAQAILEAKQLLKAMKVLRDHPRKWRTWWGVEYEDDGLKNRNQARGEDGVLTELGLHTKKGIRVDMQEVNNLVEEAKEGDDVAMLTISRKQF